MQRAAWDGLTDDPASAHAGDASDVPARRPRNGGGARTESHWFRTCWGKSAYSVADLKMRMMTLKARAAALLRGERSRAFCMNCIAARLQVTLAATRSATVLLGQPFINRYDVCSLCGKTRLVVRIGNGTSREA